MKRLLFIGLLITVLFEFSNAQTWKHRRFEIYGGIPTFHYFGDIGGSADEGNLFGLKDISIKSMRPGLTIGGIFRANDRIYLRANYSVGLITQSDKGSINEGRNFAFTSFVNEVSLQAMFFIKAESDKNYYYSVMQLRGGLNKLNKPLSVYVFFGMGSTFFSVTPKESFVGSSRFSSDESFSLAIPAGVGVKFAFSSTISFGAELGGRYLLSDYIDGFTSVNSKYNDVYYMMNLNVIYRFPKVARLRGKLR
ncbi:MAG: DUF6089 family protein [Tenuifilaceae bacterium]